jgi:chitinase
MKFAMSLGVILLVAAVPLFAQQSPQSDDSEQHPSAHKIVGYFPQWGVYGGYYVKNVITSGSATRLTHLNYAFANVVNNQCASFDTWADYQNPLTADQTVDGQPDSPALNAFAGNFHQLQELKKRYPKLHIVMSIGGGSSDPNAFSTAALPSNRRAFVKSCVDMYIHGNFAPGIHEPRIFDGIDVDWEFPASDADRKNFTALLKEFRRQLDAIRPSMTLSIASSAGSWAYQFTDLKTIQHSLSFFNLMNYDFDGPWNNTTGFVAPLYRSSKDPDSSNNADAAVEAYLELGVAPAKIVFGVPFYGYEWTGVSSIDNGLFEPGTPEGFGSGYNSIVAVESQFSKFRDPITKAPWLYDGNNFWTYDDPTSLKFKMDYVRKRHLGGVMFWEISGDLPNGTLVRTLVKGLQRKPGDEQ